MGVPTGKNICLQFSSQMMIAQNKKNLELMIRKLNEIYKF